MSLIDPPMRWINQRQVARQDIEPYEAEDDSDDESEGGV